ncbi:glycoside hydrolase family 19 protein [Petrachloros mirabilis]
MTPQQIAIGTGADLATAKLWSSAINMACLKFDITTPLRQAAFLSQIGVESAHLTALVENLNYSEQALLEIWPDHFTPAQAAEFGRTATHPANQEAIADLAYGGRMGNTSTGDGWKYRGRGLIQITGRDNYKAAGNALGLPLEDEPDRAALPNEAALTAAWYWYQHGCNRMADNRLIVAITQAINGGTNGLPDRQRLYAMASAELAT